LVIFISIQFTYGRWMNEDYGFFLTEQLNQSLKIFRDDAMILPINNNIGIQANPQAIASSHELLHLP